MQPDEERIAVAYSKAIREVSAKAKTERLPDFLVIGAMKSGTTSLYQWLDAQPECHLPATKEPAFFSDESRWAKGLAWYTNLFASAPASALTGEFSVSYTDPQCAEVAASRAARMLPDAQLVCVLRHPVDRLRSHYAHEVQRGRENRTLLEAISTPDNTYAQRSFYTACLRPWVERFPRRSLLVVRFEDVMLGAGQGWDRMCGFLGLPLRARPALRSPSTDDKAQYTPAFRWLWERGLDRWARRLPPAVRRAGRGVALRDDHRYRELLASAATPIPDDLVASVWADVGRLPELLGEDAPTWDPSEGMRSPISN